MMVSDCVVRVSGLKLREWFRAVFWLSLIPGAIGAPMKTAPVGAPFANTVGGLDIRLPVDSTDTAS